MNVQTGYEKLSDLIEAGLPKIHLKTGIYLRQEYNSKLGVYEPCGCVLGAFLAEVVDEDKLGQMASGELYVIHELNLLLKQYWPSRPPYEDYRFKHPVERKNFSVTGLPSPWSVTQIITNLFDEERWSAEQIIEWLRKKGL